MSKIISILYEGVLIRIDETSTRFDWHWPHTPIGMVKYTPRKGSKQFHYVYFGQQDETALNLANRHLTNEIAELQSRIEGLKLRLFTKENVTKQHGVVK
jgi:hypothetical protein